METAAVQTGVKWSIDPMHSEIQFKIKHLLISTVTGSFKSFHGNAVTKNENFEDAEINFSLDAKSIDTNQEMRDNHLRSPDFFNVEKFPTIDFKSISFKKTKDDHYQLTGNLTMVGVTKQVSVEAIFGGQAKDGYGNLKAGFELSGTINRKDFGLTWNSVTEAGGITLGDDIRFNANIQIAQETK